MKYYIVFFISLLSVLACGKKDPPADGQQPAAVHENSIELTDAQIANAGITTGKPEIRAMKSILRVNGKIDVPPQNMVSVSFPLGGYLKYTKLLPGMHIRKGEVIAVLEDQQYIQLQQDYLVAKARIGYLQAEFQRQQELNRSKAGSDKALQLAQAEYESQKIQIKALSEKLKLIGIKPDLLSEENLSRTVNLPSPIDGFVTQVKTNIGKYLAPTDIMFELVNPEDIHLNLIVYEKDIPLISLGQKVTSFTNDAPERKHAAEIILISKEVEDNRSVEVHCHFEKYDPRLIPGMYMNAEVTLLNKPSLVVPEEAVVRFEGQNYLFTVDGPKKYSLHPVKTGMTQDGWIELIDADKDKLQQSGIVLKNAYALLSKLKNKGEEE